MDEVRSDFSPQALAAANEANMFEAYASLGRLSGNDLYDGPDHIRLYTGVPYPLFNGVFRARLAPGDIDGTIQRLLKHFVDRNVPMLWWTGPATRPSDLGTQLLAHGLTHAWDSPGMAVDLEALAEGPVPPGLTVTRVDDTEALRAWTRPFGAGFRFPDVVVAAAFEFFSRDGFGPRAAWCHYLGWKDGQPVACSSMFLAAGVAGIYGVSTTPKARRQGIGAALTVAPLREALAIGYRIGILQSSAIGLGVYRQIGFQVCCTIGHYLWAPGQIGDTTNA